MIAYELPLVLAVVGVVIQAGTMSMGGIVEAQSSFEVFGTGLVVPYIAVQFVGFLVFMTAASVFGVSSTFPSCSVVVMLNFSPSRVQVPLAEAPLKSATS